MPEPAFDAHCALRFGRFELLPQQRLLVAAQVPVAIGSPTFDLLHCLARHQGQTLTPELLRRSVWPDRKVGDNNLRVHVTLLRKLLGDGAVAHHAARGYRFTLPVQRADGAPAAEPGARPGNLVAQLPPLIGRDDDALQLAGLLSRHPRVTLTGAAGVGKTVLALAAAAAAPGCADGAWCMELAALTEASQVCSAVATVLRLTLRGAAPRDELVGLLASRNMLLLLDNCEHVAAEVVALADALISAAPRVLLLCTSRRALKCAGEQLLRLAPLALATGAGLAAARRSAAVLLFEARARRADPRFMLTPGNADGVAAICAQLDGLPLAITLAAARVPLLGTAMLRERLVDRLRLLRSRQPEAEGRHQSLLAALDWSHDLLAAPEQAVLRRLGVFAGSFALDSVKAVADDDSLDDWAVLDALHALIEHSLLQADPAALHSEAAPRYTLHESVRLYARSRLQASDEAHALRRRHALHVLALAQGAQQAGRHADTMRPPLADADHDNLRAAQAFALEEDIALALQLAVAANTFFRQRGHHLEARRGAARLLADARAAQHPSLLARLHMACCALCTELNLLDAMQAHANAALALLQPLAGPDTAGLLGHAWAWLGACHHQLFDHAAGDAAWQQALQFHRQAGHRHETAVTLSNIGWRQAESGRHDEARASLQEALQLQRALDTRWGIAVTLENLGELDYQQRRYDAAQAHWVEALAEFRTLRHAYHEALLLRYQAQVLRRQGQPDAARAALSASLQIALPQRFPALVADAWCVLAGLLLQAGDARRAVALLHAATLLRDGVPAMGPLLHDLAEIEPAALAALPEAHRAPAAADGAGWARLARDGQLAPLQSLGLA